MQFSPPSRHFIPLWPKYSLQRSRSHVHIPSLRSFIQRICPDPRLFMIFHNKLFYGEGWLAPCPAPKLGTTPCCLSMAAYSAYSQIPSIAGGCLLHLQPEDVPFCGDKGTRLIWSLIDC
jgi:hypothetical protein